MDFFLKIKWMVFVVILLIFCGCDYFGNPYQPHNPGLGNNTDNPMIWVQDAYLKASNAQAGDRFGSAVDVSGNTAIVASTFDASNQVVITNENGMASDDNSTYGSGSVCIYEKDSFGNWYQDAYLKPSNACSYGYFGSSVAICGNIAVVGAIGDRSARPTNINDDGVSGYDDAGGLRGAVFVFAKSASGDWYQDAFLKPSNPGQYRFGYSVATDGMTIVVGAVDEWSNQSFVTNTDGIASSDTTLRGSGAVYVYKKDASGNWYQDAYLKASNPGASDCFGLSVAVDADTVVVGASFESSSQKSIVNLNDNASTDNSAQSAGAAYVFKRDGSGNWFQDAYLKGSNTEAGDMFGQSVAVDGGIVAVGAWQESGSGVPGIVNADGMASDDNSVQGAGAVYVFRQDGSGNWFQDAYLKPSNTGSGYCFGGAIDVDNGMIVVGAYSDASAQISGAAYIFRRNRAGDWYQDVCIKPSNTGGAFGYTVGISGQTVVAGAFSEPGGSRSVLNDDGVSDINKTAGDSGAAYLFMLK